MRTPHNERVGSDRAAAGPERKCILSGDHGARDGLIRLAISPDGDVLPDVLARAPGRGAWIGVDRPDLEKAIAKGNLRGALARAFKGAALTIPDSQKPGIYARVRAILRAETLIASLSGAVVLAVLVNIVELLCTAGFPAIYTQILTMAELPRSAHYAYLALYNVAYMADDALMVTIAVITLSHRKLTERSGRWLKLVSGAAMIGLAAVLLLKPELLA